ncbi:class 1b ribonucleoside-diphosphate reductase subunit beta [Senegalia massiliensis]|uniref:class 1b ribonucleoside-diphosphate reductase subunit beta n=1 Tax=Senegalia massiliensis TaxID=1720316 RepID=UPI001031462E|nr:class 1b ribonucleoside-diphosphate reductase subunit beta [Senegalia massiliensis]
MTNKIFKAVNWNNLDNDYVELFWEQNLKQFWIDTEYIPSKDINSYKSLDDNMKEAYKKVLGGLTLLDTLQSHTGMPKVIDHIDSLQNKSVLSFMCMMETIHAKSYSTIFTTVATTSEINNIFKWVEENPYLQYKANIIDEKYRKLDHKEVDDYDIYMALVASIMLESFLFYSGFFLPLWLAGQGEMVASADIIKKIVADESIHGIFVGLLAQERYEKLNVSEKIRADKEVIEMIENLMRNEFKYTEQIYTDIGLTSDVKEYLKYNANKALANMGRQEHYKITSINQIVLNGLNVETTQHDFFSKKSTNYEKTLEVVHLNDDDFDLSFDMDDDFDI